jgi:hypothetical protein
MAVLPTVRSQMQEAARREASRRAGFAPRAALQWVGPAAGIAFTVAIVAAIALAALVLVHHRQPGEASASGPAGLVARLAVLRRPQQPSDVLPACCRPHSAANGAIIPRFSRLVATRAGIRFYLVVTSPAENPKPLSSPNLGDQVAIVAIARHQVFETAGIPAADLSDPTHVTAMDFGPRSAPFGPHSFAIQIVPDGVARVRWSFRDVTGGPRTYELTGGPDHTYEHIATNNIVIAHDSVPTDPQWLQQVTWYRSNGTVAPTSLAALRQATAARWAPQRASDLQYDLEHSSPAPAQLLAKFSIFKIQSPTGVKVAPGVTILRPRLSSLPWGILSVSDPGPNMDPQELREVITPSGILVVVPGQPGLCIALIRPQPLTGLIQGGSQACTGAGLAQAESQGVSANSTFLGQSATYGIVPDSQHTLTIYPEGRRMGVRTGPTMTHTIRPIYGTYIVPSFERQRIRVR